MKYSLISFSIVNHGKRKIYATPDGFEKAKLYGICLVSDSSKIKIQNTLELQNKIATIVAMYNITGSYTNPILLELHTFNGVIIVEFDDITFTSMVEKVKSHIEDCGKRYNALMNDINSQTNIVTVSKEDLSSGWPFVDVFEE